ncbi:RNA polymerase sigma-70 factor [Echinicola sediminis]
MPFPEKYSEKRYLDDLVKGDEKAFRLFFDQYHQRVFRFAMTYLKVESLSLDLTQDVFIKIWQEKSKLKEVDHLDAYLFLIVKRKAIDYLRKISRDQKLMEQVKMEVARSEDPFLEMDNSGLLNAMKELLSPKQREVFELSRGKGMSYEEIAEQLHLSKNTVRNHMVQALKIIRKALQTVGYMLIFLMFP